MPDEFRIEEWDEVIVNGESRDFEIDEKAKVVRLRKDLSLRSLYAAGYAHGSVVRAKIVPVLRDVLRGDGDAR